MTTYTESETGALLCETCDKWIDGIGSNRCACCRTCLGEGKIFDEERSQTGVDFEDCTACNGTGKKAVA